MSLAQRYVDHIHAAANRDELLDQPLIPRPGHLDLLAENECAHGHLPGDRTLTCTCWPQRRTRA